MLSKEVLDILEQLEKEYNTMKYCYEKLTKDYNSLKKDFNELLETSNIFYNTKEKYKKAIEILKRFNFSIFTVKNNNNETAFKIFTDSLLETQEITQQEYELLKEVLSNEKL